MRYIIANICHLSFSFSVSFIFLMGLNTCFKLNFFILFYVYFIFCLYKPPAWIWRWSRRFWWNFIFIISFGINFCWCSYFSLSSRWSCNLCSSCSWSFCSYLSWCCCLCGGSNLSWSSYFGWGSSLCWSSGLCWCSSLCWISGLWLRCSLCRNSSFCLRSSLCRYGSLRGNCRLCRITLSYCCLNFSEFCNIILF